MTTETFDGVRLATKVNVCFDGRCVSHSFTLSDGTERSVDVALSAILTFGTAAAEIMECVGDSYEYKPNGADKWRTFGADDNFQVPASSEFGIRVTEAYHYICYYT